MKAISYASAIGSLMYTQVCTCPDIAFVISVLGRYLSNPGLSHQRVAKKVMRYLQGIKNLMLTYRRTNTLDIVRFSDADYAGCMDDKKSTSGYIFVMVEGATSQKSIKQTLTALSTMEAEYVACYKASYHAISLQNFVLALGVVDSISRLLKLYCDNFTIISFFKNTMSNSRSQHINIVTPRALGQWQKYHCINHFIQCNFKTISIFKAF